MFIEVHTNRTPGEYRAILINVDKIDSVEEFPMTFNEAEYTKIYMSSGDVFSTCESYAKVKSLIMNAMREG